MTVSFAEATAAARRIEGEGYPVRGRQLQHVPQAFIDDAVELAGFVLAGDTERLRAALEFYADAHLYSSANAMILADNGIRARAALAEGGV